MTKPHSKKPPLRHIYDSDLTASQKLLMTLLLIEENPSLYDLSTLAKRRAEDILFDLKELKKQGYLQDT